VDQISPPFRIALVAMLAMCALWFTVLKPKASGSEPAPTPAPGTTGLASDVTAAKGAAAASDAANAKTQAATGDSASAPATQAGTGTGAATAAKGEAKAHGAAAKPKAKAPAGAPADRSAALVDALDAKHAVVLLFWNKRGIEDKAVRRSVARVSRHDGRVVVKTVPVGAVGHYTAISRGAKVLESPTVLVMGPDRKARAVVGFTTTAELDQLAGDALRAKPAK